MENDTSFADLDHFNVVSDQFGIHFNSILRKHVVGTNWEQGKIVIDGNGPIFHHPHTIYVKDVCTITVSGPAHAVLEEGDDIFMATAKYGKGTVVAMIDPWLYNEYTDGRKLPADVRQLRRRQGVRPLDPEAGSATLTRVAPDSCPAVVRASRPALRSLPREIVTLTPPTPAP